MNAKQIGQLSLGVILALAGMSRSATTDDPPLLGFSTQDAQAERALEERFDGLIKAEHLRDWMKRLSARPHHLGSPYDKENAEFIRGLFSSWGYQVKIEEFQVLFPTPRTRLLEMTEPTPFRASLAEPPLKEDQTSGQTEEQLPLYNAYSIDGDVSGRLVYVNYGIPKDYEELERQGVDVRGKIVIARYYGSWRGIKPKVAAEHGAIGCIIYSDPRDDGYFQGDVYPKGAWRSGGGGQRGSVMDMPLHPGDPLTPGVGSTPEAKRLPLSEAATLTKIPVLPISYDDALPLLGALGGPVAPEGWRGALPITYHLGPGPARVHLKVESDWKEKVPLYNVIARMEGSERPEEWILRGNHHDAWVNGAEDPVSGTVALLEEARVVAELSRGGGRPRRTLLYCVWDGEEEGLLGSTEWAETHQEELRVHAAAYVNSDTNGRGFLHAEGSHVLERLVSEVARDVPDPQKKVSVLERLRSLRMVRGTPAEQREAAERAGIRIGALGSGSDYTVFLDHLGIASLDLGYRGENGGGSYHSIYDSFDHYTRFGDPGFAYGVALVQTAGRVMLRLVNSERLPFDFGPPSEVVAQYAREVSSLADEMREETARKNRLVREGRFAQVADPTQTYLSPKAEEPVPHLNFAPLQNAVDRLLQSVRELGRLEAEPGRSGKSLPLETRKALDALLMQSEGCLTDPKGLPRRPWYRHLIYAPGFYTGYGVKTLPGIREAIEERRWDEAANGIETTSRAIERYALKIDQVAELLRAVPKD